jgi:hypothetical protein
MRIKTQKDYLEKRKYVRLESVFPVDYAIIDPDHPDKEDSWQQGFTCNVSEGGLCLNINKMDAALVSRLTQGRVQLDLKIRIPLYLPPIRATAAIAWVDKVEDEIPSRYLIGLKFITIAKKDSRRMINHTRWVRFTLPVAGVLAGAFLLAFILSSVTNARLRGENQGLVQQLVTVQEEETEAGRLLDDISREKKNLSAELADYRGKIAGLQTQLNELRSGSEQRAQREEQLKTISRLSAEKQPLENQFASLLQRENILKDELMILKRKKEGLKENVVGQMYLWLKNHQVPATGLILSFEGEDTAIRQWSFIYDQALAVNAFLLFNDIEGGRKVLDFFKKNLTGSFKGFYNAYYADSGEVAEFTIHSGPNIWVGIAALQYTTKTQDERYLPLALAIGEWLLALQREDPAGGLRGGPDVSWFATEHNLDAYAFFKMLYQVTGQSKYQLAQAKVTEWLKTYALSPYGQDYKRPPVNRGRGDATIATDTFAWSLAAIGPAELERLGMSAEQIMEFAERHCKASVPFQRPSGAVVEVSGFDFAAYHHMPRGGLVSPEWTSQMIISFQMLGDFFADQNDTLKTGYYEEKVVRYLNEMNKLIISSPSPMGHGEGCLPYSTLEDADTGHGWRTPRGSDTCSIAGTAYMIMAIKGFNPLMLEELSHVPGGS